MPRRLLAVLLVALLAGCGGLMGGEAGAPSSTVTPAPVPTIEVPTDRSLSLPIEDIPARHFAALGEVNYTITETIRVGPADDPTLEHQTTVSVDRDRDAVRFENEVTTAPADRQPRGPNIWYDGDRSFYRFDAAHGEVRYDEMNGPPMGELRISGRLRPLFEGFSVTTTRGGANATILGGRVDAGDVPRLQSLSAIENATMTVRVGEGDLVTRLALGYDATYQGKGTVAVRYTYHLSDVGSTSPAPPSWLDNFETPAGD